MQVFITRWQPFLTTIKATDETATDAEKIGVTGEGDFRLQSDSGDLVFCLYEVRLVDDGRGVRYLDIPSRRMMFAGGVQGYKNLIVLESSVFTEFQEQGLKCIDRHGKNGAFVDPRGRSHRGLRVAPFRPTESSSAAFEGTQQRPRAADKLDESTN